MKKPTRSKSGIGWSAPGTVRIEGGSVGFQIGGSETDLIMLVMSDRGVDKLLSSKFTLGAEGSTLRQDLDDNASLYGKKLENRQIVTTSVRIPRAATKLIGLLNRHSSRERKRLPAGSAE